MRNWCYNCVIKHLGQACVTNSEAKLGYPEHIALAIGHLAEASEEIIKESPEFAEEIRDHRLKLLLDSNYDVPYMELCKKALKLREAKFATDTSPASV